MRLAPLQLKYWDQIGMPIDLVARGNHHGLSEDEIGHLATGRRDSLERMESDRLAFNVLEDGRIAPNEKKISDGYRERARIEVDGF